MPRAVMMKLRFFFFSNLLFQKFQQALVAPTGPIGKWARGFPDLTVFCFPDCDRLRVLFTDMSLSMNYFTW